MSSSTSDSSHSKQKRLRLALEIERNGSSVDFPCDNCFLHNRRCVVMESRNRLKCSECVRRGRPCVNLSWSSLDKTRDEYRKKVEEDEVLLAEVLSRLMRNKKVLRQAEERSKQKTECLMSEMEDKGELEDCPAADALVGLSPAIWSTMGFLNDSVGVTSSVFGGTSEVPVGNG